MTYREADHRARAEQLAEELENERAETRRLRQLVPSRTRSTVAGALERLADTLRSHGRWLLVATACCVGVTGIVTSVAYLWNRPDHQHVLYEGKPALLTSCSSLDDCRDEARHECGKFVELKSRSVFHKEVTVYVPVQAGKVTVMTPQTTPAHYTYELVYQCQPRETL